MSRRCHHGSPRHAPLGRAPRRPATAAPDRQQAPTSTATPPQPAPIAATPIEIELPGEPEEQPVLAPAHVESVPPSAPSWTGATDSTRSRAEQPAQRPAAPVAPRPFQPRPQRPAAASLTTPAEPIRAQAEGEDAAVERTATAPQLRRFIKSRAYVPMHELRRRFAINGADDEVTPVDLERRRVFVGLPEREGRLLGELLRAGDIGYELSLDPISPIVVGVYPMRPVTRA